MSKDFEAGKATAKQVLELATWLGNAPGWVKAPDFMYEALDELTAVAAGQLGLKQPDENQEHIDLIDVVCTWATQNCN